MAIFKRSRRNAVVASASRIRLNSPQEAARIQAQRQPWQREAFDYFDLVGEVKYAITYLGNSLSKLRLFAATREGPDDEPILVDEGMPRVAIEQLESEAGGHSEIMRCSGINLSITGECYLHGKSLPTNEQDWTINSIEEIIPSAGTGFYQPLPYGEQRPLPANDFLVRIWLPHPRNRELADSAMRGVLSSCREILLLEKAARSAARSRIAIAGILKVPTELAFGPPSAEDGDNEEDDPFFEALAEAMTMPMRDEESASATVPIVVRGPAATLEQFQHMTLDRPLDPVFDARMERALRRLAQGLNVPVEVVLGIADVNHWGAWQIEESAFKSHIEPIAMQIVEALTVGYLRPVLRAGGMSKEEAETYIVWYDPSRLVAKPNQSQNAKDAHEKVAISDEALRRIYGFSKQDAPDDLEYARRAALKRGMVDPVLVAQLLQSLLPMHIQNLLQPKGNGDGGDLFGRPELVARDRTKESPKDAPQITKAPEANSPELSVNKHEAHTSSAQIVTSDIGSKIVSIERSVADRLWVAADDAVSRSLEKIGAKIRQRVQRNKNVLAAIENISAIDIASTLGPSVVASATKLTDDQIVDECFYPLDRKLFESWVSRSQSQILSLLPIDEDDVAGLRLSQAGGRELAHTALNTILKDIVAHRMYEPRPALAASGEQDNTMMVPYGVIRGSIECANLSSGTLQKPKGNFIGSHTLYKYITSADNIDIVGFRWEYGSNVRSRDLEDHRQQDGSVLNGNQDIYPGDHPGCMCMAVPLLVIK